MFLGTILSTPGAPCSRLPQDAGSRRLNVFRPIFIRFTLRAPPIEAVGPPKDSPHKSVKTGQTHLSCVDHRSNAQISTGPTSVTGKAVSSMNSLKTGIHAKSLVLPSENLIGLEQLIEEFYRHPPRPPTRPPGPQTTPGRSRSRPHTHPGRRTRRFTVPKSLTPNHFTPNWLRSGNPRRRPGD